MSGYATPTTSTTWAGPQRSSRTSMMRRRRVQSESAATTSTDSGPRRMLLADMPEPSISDLNSSRVPSSVNFDPIPTRMRSQLGMTPESSNPSTPLTPEHQSTSAELLSQGRNLARDPPTHTPMAPFVLKVIPGKEKSHERPSIKGLFSSLSSKLDLRKLSLRRPSELSIESDRTLAPPEQPVIDIGRPLSLTYDPDTQRLTSLEAWDILFPEEKRDPFACLEVPAPPMGDTSPLSQAQQQQALVHRITQRLGSLAWSTKVRLPKTIQLLITPEKARTPHKEGAPFISAPFNLVHIMGVTEDPLTGRLLDLPEEWQPPPARRTRYSSLSSLVTPSRRSRRSSMPSTPRTHSQSGTTSSSDGPRPTQVTAPSPNPASTTPPGRRRITQSFSGRINGARLALAGLSSTSTNNRPPLGSRSSSRELPPPLPEKDPPREGRVGPLGSRHSPDAATVTRQTSTYRTPHRSEFPQWSPAGNSHGTMAESSRSRQNPQTPPQTNSFGQARHTPGLPRPPYRYL